MIALTVGRFQQASFAPKNSLSTPYPSMIIITQADKNNHGDIVAIEYSLNKNTNNSPRVSFTLVWSRWLRTMPMTDKYNLYFVKL